MESFVKNSFLLQPKQVYEVSLVNGTTMKLTSITQIPHFPLQNNSTLILIDNNQPKSIVTLEKASPIVKIDNIKVNNNQFLSNNGSEPIRLVYETDTQGDVTIKSKIAEKQQMKNKDFTFEFLLQADKIFESATSLIDIAHFFDRLSHSNYSNSFKNCVIIALRRLKNNLQYQIIDLIKVWDLHLTLKNQLTHGFKFFFDLLLKNFPELAPVATRTSSTCANSLIFFSMIIDAGYSQSISNFLQSYFYINSRYTHDILENILNFICKNQIFINEKLLQQLQPILTKEAQEELIKDLIAKPNPQVTKKLEKLQNKQNENDEIIQNLKDEVSKLNSKITQIDNEEISKRDTQIKDLQSKLEDASNKASKLESDINELSKQNHELQTNNNELSKLNNELQTKNKENALELNRIPELDKQNNELSQKIKEYKFEIDQNREKLSLNDDIQQKLSELEEKFGKLQKENEKLKLQNKKEEKEKEEAKKKIVSLTVKKSKFTLIATSVNVVFFIINIAVLIYMLYNKKF